MVCIRKTIISGAPLACRRVGSKRVKSVSSCKHKYYNKKVLFRQDVLLRNRTFVFNSNILCCLYNVGGRAYDGIEYLDPCELYNGGIYEYQQAQSVYDSDGHQEEVLVSDDTSECDSSESLPESGCGTNLTDVSDEAMDTLSNEGVDGCEEVSARHARTVISNAQNATD